MTKQLFTQLDLSDSRVRGYRAGLRPFRRGCPRLEVETGPDKVIGHNYGHGGSGITMCWGSAAEIVDMLGPWLTPNTPVAVLGAGIMGLCAASMLLDRQHPVTIYAREFPPDTTSNVAGGLWAPTHVGLGQSPLETVRHERILRRSWHTFLSLDGPLYGVEEVPLFEADDRCHPLDPMPEGLTPPARKLDRLPFRGQQPGGQVSRTLLIETPRFLQTLLDRVQRLGGQLKETTLHDPDDLQEISAPVVVNCLGLGAAQVASDNELLPIRGQLVLLDPAPRPFFLDHAVGYVISRRDLLILGGTFEEGVSDPQPVEEMCTEILNNHRRYFNIS
jgi:glycine/D-amino acid oxidase-like deaminating enzyme